MILASRVRGVELDPPLVMLRKHSGWMSPSPINGCEWHEPERVQEWVPAEVVASGEAMKKEKDDD